MIRAMDASGVEKLCVSSFLSIGPDCLAGNDMVAGAVRQYPDRFVGYAVVNPNRPPRAFRANWTGVSKSSA